MTADGLIKLLNKFTFKKSISFLEIKTPERKETKTII
jgi:hypothetical protein